MRAAGMGSVQTAGAASIDPTYLAVLGLRRAPFGAEDGPEFFYKDPALLQRLNLLRHLVQSTDFLIVVRAPEGGGKTTLLQQLRTRADESWRLCWIDGDSARSPDDLLCRLAQAFQDPASPGDGAVLRDTLIRMRGQGLLPVVLVDDAHRLCGAVLAALADLVTPHGGERPPARVVLFAEPGIQEVLAGLDLAPEACKAVHGEDLPVFSQEQTEAYLMHRLLAAGLSGDSPFTSKQVKQIQRRAGGMPGRINQQAHQILLASCPAAAGDPARHRGPTFLRLGPGIAFAGLAMVLAVGLILLQKPLGRWLSEPALEAPGAGRPPVALRRTEEGPPRRLAAASRPAVSPLA
ncbi:MAG TPA: AAA family ATPase, partial [Gammaproteobacteria bacterium]|nr:AAA family ATPase [Gammaproteobacteria bacterium]